MYKKILVPLDQSKVAEEAIPTAIAMAQAFQSKITFIYVLEIHDILPQDIDREDFEVLKEKDLKYLSWISKQVEARGVSVNTVFEIGDPGLVICRYAEKQGIDIIIMSAQGKGNLKRYLLGSVSEKVLRNSPVPVQLVRSGAKDVLRGRTVLVVDDEPDVLESVADQLDMCVVHKALDHDTALEFLDNHRYDIAILDIMGVDGFDLLKQTIKKGIPTLMFTAHALTPENLSKSARLGAVSFVPKEKIADLEKFLVDVIQGSGTPVWKKLFDRISPYFRDRFGWSPKAEEELLREFEGIFEQ